ncbi:MAG: dihydrofolate reductase family protein [Anaerolineaceae bacterium]
MRKLFLFMLTSLDGYFEDERQSLDWHNVDLEFERFSIEQLSTVDTILFGRKTYEMMAAFWPTDYAIQTDPITAERMNSLPKLVFSKSLKTVSWQNTRIIHHNEVGEVITLKQSEGGDIAVFGSSDLGVTLLQAGLLDEIRVLVNPLVLGSGKSLFAGLDHQIKLRWLSTRTFKNGNVLLTYQPD